MGRWHFLKIGVIVLFLSILFFQQGFTQEKYTVKSGDTLYGISKWLGIDVEVLKRSNGLQGATLQPNQVLIVPLQKGKQVQRASEALVERPTVESNRYIVQKGDTLYHLSRKMGLSVEAIQKMNHLPSTAIKVGQILILPKSEILFQEEAEELGDGEGETEIRGALGEKEDPVASTTLGKWGSSEERSLFVRVVKTFLGVPYRLGGSTLKGIDCSALVKRIYEIFNIDLPRTAREQFRIGKFVEKDKLEEGDLVFFSTRRANNAHVGIYIGGNQFIHASSRNREVKIDQLDKPYFNQRFLRGVRVKEMERESL
jgi:cell wall-associated NlpC family hydrolase